MAKNTNDLFKWNKNDIKKEKHFENDRSNYNSNNYWQKRTTRAAEEAVRCATGIHLNDKTSIVKDEVYEEAQEVVRGWLTNQKIYGPYNDRETFLKLSSEEPFYQPNTIEIHKEWEHLIKKLETNEDYQEQINAITENENKDIREDKQLHVVMKNLHNKSFVKMSKLRCLDSFNQVDVVKKMENRQDQVKKNREERLKYEEVQRMNKLAKKEARLEAMKMLKDEQHQKECIRKREEELIQMEMFRIRAEINSQREEERERTYKTQRDDLKKEGKVKPSVQVTKEITHNNDVNHNDKFRMIQEIVDKKFVNKNLAILRRCFQVWRDEIEKRRIEIQKAAAWNVWQITRKTFKAWRRYARLTAINRKIENDQERLRHIQRNDEMASNFWKKAILKKCLLYWGLYVVSEKETKWFEKLEEMRKLKMTKYIDVLQEKAIENQKKLNVLSFESKQFNDKIVPETQNSFHCTIESERAHTSSVNVAQIKTCHHSARQATKSFKVPKEAWQITKKHVSLPIEQLLGNVEKDPQESINFKALRPPKIVDNYANRNAAQKELIEHQRLKLQEQERVINELVNNHVLLTTNEESSRPIQIESNSIRLLSINEINKETCNENDVKKEIIHKKINKFVLQMDERSKERERIKNERLVKQKKHEEEKRKILAEQIAEQCRTDATEKQKREHLLKEKREKVKLNEEMRKRNLQIEQDKNNKADQFYKSLLLKNYGIKSWKMLMEMEVKYSRLAEDYYKKKILKKVMGAWSADVNKHRLIQNEIIHSFYSKMLQRRCFHHFKIFKERFTILEQKAHSHYLETLKKKTFQFWRLYNHRSQIRLDKLDNLSVKLYRRHLLKTCFYTWKQLPVASRFERERERRKETMRKKVASIIPDFKKDL